MRRESLETNINVQKPTQRHVLGTYNRALAPSKHNPSCRICSHTSRLIWKELRSPLMRSSRLRYWTYDRNSYHLLRYGNPMGTARSFPNQTPRNPTLVSERWREEWSLERTKMESRGSYCHSCLVVFRANAHSLLLGCSPSSEIASLLCLNRPFIKRPRPVCIQENCCPESHDTFLRTLNPHLLDRHARLNHQAGFRPRHASRRLRPLESPS